ncbi:hypothetical protein COCNU_06G005880 [Cocos nucifera]|uniref:Uncharacterized protein n=1 Tax=Cocos nucifera TaxID=13894 RepID=A0A8K0IAI9_COCNU|nr:hypothetical protein COCNU_06G005880 [Cocos nucifera]
MEALMKLSLKVPLLVLLLVLVVVSAQDLDTAPSPAPVMENGSVAASPGLFAVVLAYLVSFVALFAH